MKDAYYFSHDSNARYDPKILALRSVYGVEGYGRYWILVEMLREADGYTLNRDKYFCQVCAMQMQCTPDVAEQFINDCIEEFHLFVADNHSFWSPSLLRRMGKVDHLREQRRQAANVRWGRNATVLQPQCESNAIKVKESIVKETKENPPLPPQDPVVAVKEKNIFTLYENNIGMLNPLISEELKEAEKVYPAAWVEDAFKEAVTLNKRSWRYIEAILKRWAVEGKNDGKLGKHQGNRGKRDLPARDAYPEPSEI